MSLHHATSGEIINIRPLGSELKNSVSSALLKTAHLEVMHLILNAGRTIPEHMVASEMTIQCIEGAVELQAHQKKQIMHAGEMVYLAGSQPYALRAVEDSSLLVTMLLQHGSASLQDTSVPLTAAKESS